MILWRNLVDLSNAGQEEVLNELYKAYPGAPRMKSRLNGRLR